MNRNKIELICFILNREDIGVKRAKYKSFGTNFLASSIKALIYPF